VAALAGATPAVKTLAPAQTRRRGNAKPSARRWWRRAISLIPGGEFLYRLHPPK
jgi:hypothetical protein